MGNRANIIFPQANVAIYLHWNGGIESVVAFLDYANELRLDAGDYGAARFAQIVGNYFGGTMSLGVRGCICTTDEDFANWADEDNGAFVIGAGADGLCVKRWFVRTVYPEPASEVPAAKLAEAIKAARAHKYNVKGEMLAEVRAKNAHAKKEAGAA